MSVCTSNGACFLAALRDLSIGFYFKKKNQCPLDRSEGVAWLCWKGMGTQSGRSCGGEWEGNSKIDIPRTWGALSAEGTSLGHVSVWGRAVEVLSYLGWKTHCAPS